MKKTAAFLLSAFACLFLLSGCNDALDGGAQSGSETTESADIYTTVDDALPQEPPTDIGTALTYTSDFDSDGENEDFILAGSGDIYKMTGDFAAELYYRDGGKYTRITGSEYGESYVCDGMLQYFGDTKVLILSRYFTTNNVNRFFAVFDGVPVELAPTVRGGSFETMPCHTVNSSSAGYDGYTPDAAFSLLYSETDFAVEGGGRTWKRYFFFWDDSRHEMHEYGRIAITEAQLLRCDGAVEVFGRIASEGGKIADIYYRDCGIVNVDYTVSDHEDTDEYNRYITLLVKENGSVAVTERGEGCYLAAAASDIAVYPDGVPNFMLDR